LPRDLKPENIIFANSERDAPLKIIDFGTSRKFTNKNMTKKLGTVSCLFKLNNKPYYIAPEVLS